MPPIEPEQQQMPDDPSIVFVKKSETGKPPMAGLQDWIYRDPQAEIQGNLIIF